VLLEAPNWAPDGAGLLLNGAGLLWRLDLEPEVDLNVVPIDDLPPINNDHVLDPPRGLIYLSANDGHIYVAPTSGGTAQRVTHDSSRYHFLHGVSPDGATLAFVELPRAKFSEPGRLALIASIGGETRYPSAGSSHLDGPEYSPDGAWLYLNTEEYASRPGHAQLARVPVGGGPIERLLESDTVDWFPHLSPDGKMATYISFPMGTLGHPADLEVEVRLVRTARRTGATSSNAFRFSVDRGRSTSTAGRQTDAGSPTLPIQSNPICSSSDRVRKVFRYRSSTFPSTGLRSTIGVPSMASRPLT